VHNCHVSVQFGLSCEPAQDFFLFVDFSVQFVPLEVVILLVGDLGFVELEWDWEAIGDLNISLFVRSQQCPDDKIVFSSIEAFQNLQRYTRVNLEISGCDLPKFQRADCKYFLH